MERRCALRRKFRPEGHIEIDPLKERLQRALGPDYRVERRLGSGGMGFVYLAHNLRLDRAEAVKVLRPELDTAEGGEAFLREARMVASIRHPNVVVIYNEGEGEGLKYYLVELVGGPTLEERLASGAAPAKQVVQIGSNLLDGLEHVHRLGLVHRDIKPSNVFLLSDRALLGDFGIARPYKRNDGDTQDRKGTPDYMAPEQVEGKPTTPRTDIYSTGVVLYEAVKARKFHEQGAHVDWSEIPDDLAAVLQRAVAEQPDDRWPDAAAFRHALEGTLEVPRERAPEPTHPPPPSLPKRIIVVVAIVVGVVAVVILPLQLFRSASPAAPPVPPPQPTITSRAPLVTLNLIDYVGPADRRGIPDSLIQMVQRDLGSHITFVDSGPGALIVQARLTVTGTEVKLRLTGGIPPAEFRAGVAQWPTLRDSLSYQIALGVWADRSALSASLPTRALPHTTEGLIGFFEGEELVAQTQYEKADRAYRRAELADPTCWVCSWRITEVGRWLSVEPDPDRVRRYRLHADSLPTSYRRFIRAAQLPERARLDTLTAVTEDDRKFFLGWFQLGDELFHRGPLVGHRRSEAILAFERAARLRPDFRPTWEHLAWVATAEGDSADAANALDSLESHSGVPGAFSREFRALLQVGFAWRFFPDTTARRITLAVSGDPATQSSPDFAAGPRMLPTFDVPRGTVALGEMLAQTQSRDLQRSGLVAQTLGALALGQVDSARALSRRLVGFPPQPELDFFPSELQATLAVVDSGSVPIEDARGGLRHWLLSDNDAVRDRATWISSLLEHRSRLLPSAPRELRLAVTAESLAAQGLTGAALRLLDQVNVDSVARTGDPFFRTVVHFRRAAWRAQIGDIAGANAELIWSEHEDLVGLPTEKPQAAEVDWAFATLARWRLARLLDGPKPPQRDEACAAYAAVVRHWSQAPAPFGARADTARARVRALKCAATTR